MSGRALGGKACAVADGGNWATMTDAQRANQIPALLCLVAVAVNHSVFRLGAMPWAGFLLAVAIIAIAVFAPSIERPRDRLEPFRWWNAGIGLVLLAPLFASLILGWRREFPFSGDQLFHVKQMFYMAFWWAQPPGTPPVGISGGALDVDALVSLMKAPWRLLWSRAVVLVAVAFAAWRFYRLRPLAAVAFLAVALIAWGLFERTLYLRYPGGVYALLMPLAGLGYALGGLDLPGRLVDVTAAVAWLFVLRPWLLGRWPDARLLPAAALLLWQKDVLYYFDSAYLEPWAVIFSLLAVECLFARGRDGAPVACLLIGLAAVMKEPFIFALPFVWLAGVPWRGSIRSFVHSVGVGLCAGVPFVMFFLARRSAAVTDPAIDRPPDFVAMSLPELGSYFSEFAHQMSIAFAGPSAVAALGALIVAIVLMMRDARARVALICLFAAAICVILLFAFDHNSIHWAGYFRFLLPSLPFLAAGAVALGYALSPRWTFVVGAVVLGLQAPGALLAVQRSAGPASDRNFVETYDSPIVFPLKSIVAEAERGGIVPPRASILASQPDEAVRPIPGLNLTFGPLGELHCECSADRPRLLNLFVRYANVSASFADRPPPPGEVYTPPRGRDAIWRANRGERAACIARMRQTCTRVLERAEGGEIVAVLGAR